jgi:ferric-dicitrate binding protein FerR (iron transport regulator)
MNRCPSERALSRAFPEAGTELARHLATCGPCRSTWHGFEELARIGKQLPVVNDSEPSLRARVLAAAAADRRPKRSKRWIAAPLVAAVAAGIGIALVMRPSDPIAPAVAVAPKPIAPVERTPEPMLTPKPEPKPDRLAAIRGSKDAVFARRIESGQGEIQREVVELKSGRIDLEVAPLEGKSPVLMVTRNAEIEVEGASFTAIAEGGRLVRIEVVSGHVELRPRRGAPVLLAAGDHWTPPPKKTPRAIEPPPLEPTPIEKVEVDPSEDAFLEGWRRLKAGNHAGAAESFAITAQDATHPMAEDADYWRAIALARAGDTDPAIAAMRAFLEHRPASRRAGEMALMLGLQLAELDRQSEARPLFERALHDPSPEIRERARRALATIER